MRQYLDLMSRIVNEGEDVQSGATIVSENRKPSTRTLFAAQFRHDLADGFPAMTTRKLYFENVVREVLWFLRGDTNVKTLGCGIWNSWSNSDGEVAAAYGSTWRHWVYSRARDGGPVWFSSTHDNLDRADRFTTFDQVAQVVRDLKEVASDPFSRARRRIILTGWNPPLVGIMGLPPCHTMAQFLPVNGVLNTHCFWRSIDMFLGFPFNATQYALLTHLLCELTGLKPGKLVASITDCHLYENQMASVAEQLKRDPLPHPTLVIDPRVKELAPDLSIGQVRLLDPSMFRLDGYTHDPGPRLKAEVAV